MYIRTTLATVLVCGAALCSSASAAGTAQPPLAGVMFEGVSAYSPEALLPLYRAELGQPIDDTLSTRIAASLIARYDADGALPPSIELVPFDTAPGVLVFNVKEPAVRRVTVSGKELITDARFWQQLTLLKAQQPLGKTAFHDWLGHVNQLDGMNVSGRIVPLGGSTADYAAELRITAPAWSGMLHVDNRAPEALGNEVAQGQAVYRLPGNRPGQVRLGGAVALDVERLKYASIAGTHTFNDAGSAFDWSVSGSESALPSGIADESDDYDRSRKNLALRTPLHRSATGRIDAWTSFQLYDVEKSNAAGELVREDRIRSVELGVSGSAAGLRTRRHDATLSLIRGLDAFDATVSEVPGTEQPVIDSFRVLLSYRLAQQFSERWTTSFAVQSQWSADHLPVSERFFIGGRQLGGAFDPASVTGDCGIGARVEVARGVSIPFVPTPLQPYAYYDHALASSNNRDFESDMASSVGAGVRFSIGKLGLYLEVATPLQEPDTNPFAEDGTRVFFSLTQRFM